MKYNICMSCMLQVISQEKNKTAIKDEILLDFD